MEDESITSERMTGTFEQDLEALISRHSLENESMTPDFILAGYLKDCLDAWNKATRERDRWWSHKPSIGGGSNMSDKIDAARPVSGGEPDRVPEYRFTETPKLTQGLLAALHDLKELRDTPGHELELPSLREVVDRILGHSQLGPLKPLGFPFGLLGAVNQVYLFHEKFGVPWITDKPTWPGRARAELRWRLMTEERDELSSAWGVLEGLLLGSGLHKRSVTAGYDILPEDKFRKAMAAVARELVDQIYVIIGTAGEFGIDLDAVWDVVHQANMAKEGGSKREDGKVLKPPGWQEPDVEGVLFGKTT